MNGILCINKPQGFTSFDVVAKLRGITQTKKIGHSGTLDPMATGVLPVFIGVATKAIDLMPDHTKRYTAGFRLGETTDTLDITGKLLIKKESNITSEQIEKDLEQFRGEVTQLPPMYSAVKVNGQRLYELARQGKQAERKPRKAYIHMLKLDAFDQETQQGTLDIQCSQGTYIRTLIDDLGSTLGVGGVMTKLIRTRSGCFTIEQAITFENIQNWKNSGELADKLLPVDHVFKAFPKIHLNQHQSKLFLNGIRLGLDRLKYNYPESQQRVYNYSGEFLGIAKADKDSGELIIKKIFYARRPL